MKPGAAYTTLFLLAALAPARAEAVHFNRGHFVTAFQGCDAMSANVLTSNGVPACAPAARSSDCATDAALSLELGSRGKTSFNIRPKGRRRTRANGGKVDVDTRVKVVDVRDCTGRPFDGDLQLIIAVRMFHDDPACASGECTVPDFAYSHPLHCRRGRCKLLAEANSELTAQGLPPLPSDHAFTLHILAMTILDPGGRPFLRVGVRDGNADTPAAVRAGPETGWLVGFIRRLTPLPAHAYGSTGLGAPRRLEASYVQAYPPCLVGAEDTTTSSGQAACTTTPLSNCSVDPAHAVVAAVATNGGHNDSGKAKLNVGVRNSQLTLHAQIRGFEDCSGTPYSGPLRIGAIAQVTLASDPSCGSTCTTVPTELFATEIDLANGDGGSQKRRVPLESLGPFPGETTVMSAEIQEIRYLDASGNTVLTGPSLFVRCNRAGVPNVPGGSGFCFGN